jgi:AcrR family transcriptional regulator
MATRNRRADPSERREQLLDAAEAVLLERGPGAMTMAEVAEVAGLAKGTTYLYFASKDELVAAVRSRYLARYLDALGGEHREGVLEQLVVLATGLVTFGQAHRRLHHRLFHEAGFSEDDALSAVRTRMLTLLSEGARAGTLAVADPEDTASFLLHGVHGVLLHHPADPAAAAATVARLVRRCLAPEAGGGISPGAR